MMEKGDLENAIAQMKLGTGLRKVRRVGTEEDRKVREEKKGDVTSESIIRLQMQRMKK